MSYPQNIYVMVDTVVFAYQEQDLQVLLIERKNEPYRGKWALPGGFVEDDESLEKAALRELQEETGAEVDSITQLHTFGQPGRDPRGRAISVTYFTQVNKKDMQLQAATDAAEARWFSMDTLPELAFDHQEILAKARQALLTS